jgi:hypothetical protein
VSLHGAGEEEGERNGYFSLKRRLRQRPNIETPWFATRKKHLRRLSNTTNVLFTKMTLAATYQHQRHVFSYIAIEGFHSTNHDAKYGFFDICYQALLREPMESKEYLARS